jgi:hypothetical protein
MKLIISLFVVCCLLVSCDDYLDRIIHFLDKESLEITKKYGLIYGSHGGNYNEEKAESLSVKFYKNKKVELSESRKLFISVHRDFFNSIKREVSLEEDINKESFSMHDLCLNISFKDKEENFFYSPYVGVVVNRRGFVYFSFLDEKTKKTMKHEETLEEAYRIVEEEERLSL